MKHRRAPARAGTQAGDAPRIVVIGLGPAGARLRSKQAIAALARIRPLYLRTARHPGTKALLRAGARSLDHCYEQAVHMKGAYDAMREELVAAARRHGRIAYAVPGSPFVLEDTVAALVADERVVCEFVASMSFLDLCWPRLKLDPLNAGLRLLDGEGALEASTLDSPALIAQLWSKERLSDLKVGLEAAPARAVLLHHLGLSDERVLEVDFADIDRVLEPDHLTSLYLPLGAQSLGGVLAEAAGVVASLRARCPWDRDQTHRSLVRHLLEETYETIDAIEDLGEPPDLAASAHLEEELGDVLCQVLFHAQIATEEGLFSLGDVARTLIDKLVGRHPHVFGEDAASADAAGVLAEWEHAKAREKGRRSLLDGIPETLPALAYAEKLARRAAAVGLLSPDAAAAALPGQLDAALSGDPDALGDALLSLCVLAADAGAFAEDALRQAARRAGAQVRALEDAARLEGVELAQASAAERAAYLARHAAPRRWATSEREQQ